MLFFMSSKGVVKSAFVVEHKSNSFDTQDVQLGSISRLVVSRLKPL